MIVKYGFAENTCLVYGRERSTNVQRSSLPTIHRALHNVLLLLHYRASIEG